VTKNKGIYELLSVQKVTPTKLSF